MNKIVIIIGVFLVTTLMPARAEAHPHLYRWHAPVPYKMKGPIRALHKRHVRNPEWRDNRLRDVPVVRDYYEYWR